MKNLSNIEPNLSSAVLDVLIKQEDTEYEDYHLKKLILYRRLVAKNKKLGTQIEFNYNRILGYTRLDTIKIRYTHNNSTILAYHRIRKDYHDEYRDYFNKYSDKLKKKLYE